MCGIAGMVGQPGETVDAATIRQMCQTLIHRGPDDEGIHVHRNVGLGIRRLSIIDLAGGHQPIHNEDQSVWLVVNGEIYNYLELRAQLERRGHRFYTKTDGEVIVHLYEEYGADCVQKLRGMFAFGLYDRRTHSLLLARDRLGKKPLYYAICDGRMLFASEIKALLAVAPQLTQPNPEALLRYFYFGYIADPATAFARIEKLSPGFVLHYVDGRLTTRQYWDLPEYGTVNPSSEEECLEAMEQRLTEAVRLRLMSEVPLGALLSGGADSSLVVALMAKASAAPVKTFSVGFADHDFDEAPYARAVAEKFGTDHHEIVVEPKIEPALEFLSRTMEEPFGDSSMIPTYYICQTARRHVTVALSGDGGDELFAGYDRYRVHLNRQKFESTPLWMSRRFRENLYPKLRPSFSGRRLAFNLSLRSLDRYADSIAHLPVLDRERSLFSSELLAWADDCHKPSESFQEHYHRAPASDELSRLLYLDTKTYLPADILTKVDRMSMANSLEVRCPLLDHVFVEWVTGLHPSWKLRRRYSKYSLKKLAERAGVPAKVLHRPKRGFAMPLKNWWCSQLKNELLELLLEPRTLQRGYFNAAAVRHLLSEHRSGRRDRSYDLWLLLIFELWHRNFLEPRGLSPTASSIAPVHDVLEQEADCKTQPSPGNEVACPLKP